MTRLLLQLQECIGAEEQDRKLQLRSELKRAKGLIHKLSKKGGANACTEMLHF